MNASLINRNTVFALILMLISWAMYTYTVFASKHLEQVQFNVERGIIATTVSHILYHSRFSAGYIDVYNEINASPVTKNNIELARSQGIVSKQIRPLAGPDGFALIFIYNLAMQLFGVNIYSIFWIFSILLLISHAIYTIRFNDYRFIFVPLSLLALTLMVFTPYVTDDYISSQVPIGGYRYFTILAAVPTIHVLFELWDVRNISALAFFCLSVQTILIGLSNFVAKSGAYSWVALILFSLIYLYNKRQDRHSLNLFKKKLVFIFSILMIFSLVFYIAIPKAYKHYGVATDNVWHRVLISLGMHPEWPFQDIKEKYKNCSDDYGVHKGLTSVREDWNGNCIWSQYIKEHPNNDPNDQGKAEKVKRNAFFMILFKHPVKVFETFFYYKVISIIDNVKIGFGYGYNISMDKLNNTIPLVISFFVLICSWFYFFSKNIYNHLSYILYTMFLFILSIFSMYIVAWGIYATMFEFFFILHIFMFISLMLSINFVYEMNKLAWRRV